MHTVEPQLRQLEIEAQGHYEGREIQPWKRRVEFEGQSTQRRDYVPWELPAAQEAKAQAPRQVLPFSASTTNRTDYQVRKVYNFFARELSCS